MQIFRTILEYITVWLYRDNKEVTGTLFKFYDRRISWQKYMNLSWNARCFVHLNSKWRAVCKIGLFAKIEVKTGNNEDSSYQHNKGSIIDDIERRRLEWYITYVLFEWRRKCGENIPHGRKKIGLRDTFIKLI